MISVIIPILDEEETIGRLLQHLLDTSKNSLEILVVDGGSTDNSQNIVKKFSNVILLESEKGRAKQMNVGAKQSSGNILYFLHADSFPPNDFDVLIFNEVNKGNKAGCFRMQFDSKHCWLGFTGWLTRFNCRICRGGDQSLFIEKELFENIGGYDERYVIYEDNILTNELYSRNEFVVIPKTLKTSARLYQKHGVWKLQYHFCKIHIKKLLGANADELHDYYKKHIC